MSSAGDAEERRRLWLRLQALRKPSDGVVARYLNRSLSLRLTALLLRTNITPNTVTSIAFAVGMTSVVPLLAGGRLGFVAGALLFQAQSVLDGCDGELARLRDQRSRLGEWWDQVADDLVNLAFFVAAGARLHADGSRIAGPVAIVATVCLIAYQISLYVALWTRGGRSGSVTSLRWWGQSPSSAPRSGFARVLEDLGRRDFFAFAYLPAALLGVPIVAFLWHAAIGIVSGVMTSLQWLVGGGPQAAAE